MEYELLHIPINSNTRTGKKTKKSSITIHSTANPKSTALNERNWLVNPNNKRVASWHIAVDDEMVVEAIPLDEQAYHSGNGVGNNSSIGIEICESGNREKTIQNTIELVSKMLYERNWNVSSLRRHYDWSGKNCPRIFSNDNWKDWHLFKLEVEKELNKLSNPNKVEQKVSEWAKSGQEFVIKHNISDGTRPKDIATREEIWSMFERYNKGVK